MEVLDKRIWNPDDTVKIGTKHKAKTEEPKENSPQRKVHEILHDDIASVLSPRQARFQHGKTRLHEEDQGSAEKNPNRIDRGIPARSSICGQSG